jgi:hypothetical protein
MLIEDTYHPNTKVAWVRVGMKERKSQTSPDKTEGLANLGQRS